MVELSLRHVYKKYKNADDYAVTDFNLDVNDREFIVFVGPSGCGKSTTLRMIAGLEEISKGELVIDGRVVNEVAPKNRNISMVFQSYALYPHMTVYNNMAFGLKLRKYDKKEIDQRVHHAAQILGIEDYLQRKPFALSGGQRQRVALGRAIVKDAPIFLMDEPLSNLDAKLRVSMRAEIERLHQHLKSTVIYVTHDQTEAMTMADRIVIMKDGKVQQIGTPQEVYSQPVNMFVAGFIGSPAMNFFEVRLSGDQIKDEKGSFSITVPEGILKHLKENGWAEKKLVFGIRPEDVHTENTFLETFPGSAVTAKVTLSELLGAESQFYSKVGDTEFVAKVDSRDHVKSGTTMKMGFDVNKAHFFDPESQKTIY